MLTIANKDFSSRLFLGSGKYGSADVMKASIQASGSELITLALKRVDFNQPTDDIVTPINELGLCLLPNTSGARTADEAVYAARLAKEALQTNWLKLEIHPDPNYLLPDPIETLRAAEQLVKEGFVVLPYCGADPVLCKRLEEVGCAAVMPLGAPIGSNKGLLTRDFLRIIIEQTSVPVVVDAGIGAPSQAAEAMELGTDAVLVNTAIATANDPVAMSGAFKHAIAAGRTAYEAGLSNRNNVSSCNAIQAKASSPLTEFLETL